LIVQLIATHSDELLSRIMAIYMTEPLFVAKLLGDYGDGEGEDQKNAIEDLIGDLSVEPEELDLYRVEETWWASAIKYGTGIVKFPWEYMVEKHFVHIGGGTEEGTTAQYREDEVVKRDGPRPENVPLNLFGIDPKFPNLDSADFFYHVLHKDKYQLERMKAHPELFDTALVDKIMGSPDRQEPEQFTMELQGSGRYGFTFYNECAYEWDIYECHMQYYKDGEIQSLIGFYHLYTDTLLGVIYNPYPKNQKIFQDAKLAYDDETYYGYGFCEMLNTYQAELSDTRNWKLDNKRFATTGIGRVNPNSKLSSIIQIFPGAFIPASEGEIEMFPTNTGALNNDTSDEMFIESAAQKRSGIDPATGGSGGGVVNQKRGIYSSQGTAMVLQAQNNRNNLRMSDMRAAHVKLGRKVMEQYSNFGMGAKLRKYGDKAKLIQQALDNYKDGKLGLVIKPATASLNKELEKQNDILLSATMERFFAGDAQILQSLSMPGIPDLLKQYYVEVLNAKNALMVHIFRNFGHEDSGRLIPGTAIFKSLRSGGNNGQQQQQGQQTGGAGAASAAQGSIRNVVPIGAGASPNTVPTGTTSSDGR
jgi:hypothetical protein